MTTPDDYESADDTDTIAGFPDDSSTGKHYLVAVPDYLSGANPALGSYFRHGVPHSEQATYTPGDPSFTITSQYATQLGDDLLAGVTPPPALDTAAGGVRDHTDGNRIVTTRQDLIEVVGGQYRLLILNNQPAGSDPDPDWEDPADLNEETSVHEHVYPDKYYDITSTTFLPGTTNTNTSATVPLVGEARYTIDQTQGSSATFPQDIYEYTNGNHVYEVIVGQQSLVEKSYGNTIHGVSSAIHVDHPEWETNIDEDGTGAIPFTVDNQDAEHHFDLAELLLAHRLLEVSRAKTYFEERLVCDDGDFLIVLGANRDRGTFTDKTWGHKIVLDESATDKIEATTHSGREIFEKTTADAEIIDITTAGAMVLELTQSPTSFDFTFTGVDVEVAVHSAALEVASALIALVDVSAAPISVEASFAKLDLEYHNGHRVEASPTKTEVNASMTKIANAFFRISSEMFDLQETHVQMVKALVIP